MGIRIVKKGIYMKSAVRIIVGVVICIGFAQVTSPKTVKVKLIKENPALSFRYAIETQPGSLRLQEMKKESVDLKYPGTAELKTLHVQRADDEDHMLDLKSEEKAKQSDLIAINEAGFPRYTNKQEFETFKKMKSKL